MGWHSGTGAHTKGSVGPASISTRHARRFGSKDQPCNQPPPCSEGYAAQACATSLSQAQASELRSPGYSGTPFVKPTHTYRSHARLQGTPLLWRFQAPAPTLSTPEETRNMSFAASLLPHFCLLLSNLYHPNRRFPVLEGDKVKKEVDNGGYNVHPVPPPNSEVKERIKELW